MVQRVGDIFKAGNRLHIQFSDDSGQLRECTALIKTMIKGLKYAFILMPKPPTLEYVT